MKDSDMLCWFMRSTDAKFFCPGPDFSCFTSQDGKIKDTDNRKFYMEQFYKELQGLAYKSTRISRPFVPYVNGVIGDAGVALALHARQCVVGPNAVLSHNQVSRGWFPDGGSTYILARLDSPGLGMFLALTGTKLRGFDLVASGYVDHYLDVNSMDALVGIGSDSLSYAGFEMSFNDATGIAYQMQDNDHTFFLANYYERIAQCFDKDSVEGIVSALGSQGEWGQECLAKINAACPTSIKLTHRLIRNARHLDFKSCLKQEYYAALNMMNRADFHEGLATRTNLAPKNGPTPKFYPSQLNMVDLSSVEELLRLPKGAEDLNLDAFEPFVAPIEIVDTQPFEGYFSNRMSRAKGLKLARIRNVNRDLSKVKFAGPRTF
jgi:enoyl-CoA hydratase/carnithine racemase